MRAFWVGVASSVFVLIACQTRPARWLQHRVNSSVAAEERGAAALERIAVALEKR